MGKLGILDQISIRALAMERYAPEFFLIASSAWAAWALWDGPTQYFREVLWISRIDPDERHWAFLLAMAAVGGAAGLYLCVAGDAARYGLPLRMLGASIGGFFWCGIGMSVLIVNPHTVGGIPMMLIGLSGWWVLLRFPAMPRRLLEPAK